MNAQNTHWRLLAVVAAVGVLLQLVPVIVGRYGFFIDELYYLACARHLAWGYIDHPPVAPAILAAATAMFGTSLFAIRVIPALCGAATILIAGRTAARLGAAMGGQLLAAFTTLLTPTLLVMFGIYTTNAIDILLWVIALSLLLELELGAHPRLWLYLGAVLGLAQMTKHTTFALAGAIALAALVSPVRKHYTTRWPWLGAAAAAAIVAPNIIWEFRNDWLTVEFARNAYLYKNLALGPLEVLGRQAVFSNPGSLPLWLGGLALLVSGRARGRTPGAGRAVGWTCMLLLILMMLTHQARPDRIAAIFPALFAAGAALWTRVGGVRFGRAVQALVAVGIVTPALIVLPLFVPMLPPSAAAAWNAKMGLDVQIERGAGKVAALPQWLADRFGWEEYVADVALAVDRAGSRLTDAQLENLVVIANSYGHAGALELFGRDLPPVFCTQNNYILWGPPDHEVDAVIVTGDTAERLGELFEHVELLLIHDCDYCMTWRDELPIWLVWGPRMDLRASWMALRHLE